MPSEKKTEKLKLNQWQENEYPKMMDFNDDNKRIDDAYIEILKLIEDLNIDIGNIDISDDLNKLKKELIQLIKKAGKVDTVNNIEADENKNITLNIEDIPKLTNYLEKLDDEKVNKKDLKIHLRNDINESLGVKDFETGITISTISDIEQFPSIKEFGMAITFINKRHGGYGQLIITNYGDIWSRRTNSLTTWNQWYSNKNEIEKKVDIKDFNAHIKSVIYKNAIHGIKLNKKNELEVFNGNKWITINPVDDTTNSPGNKHLIAGTVEHGFFGEVSTIELIRGDDLCNMLGITQGINQFSDEPWLKFAFNGKILFRTKKAIRHSISWNHLNDKNCIYGDNIIEIKGVKYKVRLMKGALTDPCKFSDLDKGAKNSEWNKLILPIHIESKDKNWGYPENVEKNIPCWDINYTDTNLELNGYRNGRFVWCQEQSNKYENIESAVVRGGFGVSHSDSFYKSYSDSLSGFAPVLEVIE